MVGFRPREALLAGSEMTERCTPPPPSATPKKSSLKRDRTDGNRSSSILANGSSSNLASSDNLGGNISAQASEADLDLSDVRVARKLSWHDQHGVRRLSCAPRLLCTALRSPRSLPRHRNGSAQSAPYPGHPLPAHLAFAVEARAGHDGNGGWRAGNLLWGRGRLHPARADAARRPHTYIERLAQTSA